MQRRHSTACSTSLNLSKASSMSVQVAESQLVVRAWNPSIGSSLNGKLLTEVNFLVEIQKGKKGFFNDTGGRIHIFESLRRGGKSERILDSNSKEWDTLGAFGGYAKGVVGIQAAIWRMWAPQDVVSWEWGNLWKNRWHKIPLSYMFLTWMRARISGGKVWNFFSIDHEVWFRGWRVV